MNDVKGKKMFIFMSPVSINRAYILDLDNDKVLFRESFRLIKNNLPDNVKQAINENEVTEVQFIGGHSYCEKFAKQLLTHYDNKIHVTIKEHKVYEISDIGC